jgi:hypothetical protein
MVSGEGLTTASPVTQRLYPADFLTATLGEYRNEVRTKKGSTATYTADMYNTKVMLCEVVCLIYLRTTMHMHNGH